MEVEQEVVEEEEDSLTATSSSPSTARPDLRVITLHIHQRWRTVWPARTALITDTSAHLGVTSLTSLTSGTSRHRPTRSPLLLDLTREDTREVTRVVTREEDSQEDSQVELPSAGGWAVATTAPATPATAPASAWWGSARRSTTTGPPAW